ncbi:MAG: SGNH/GDSL hydrolase family protein [Cellulophaga sp.]|uniref:SGNH/GDSL hydrolase family protein n=1 Tax=unclassified Cellulophaga TaxID=2634405 RepID=UPI0026E45212|nr:MULTISPECIES: SGNH/GDSL hydrolase family protein [unclassified Cellulophaga]MDO6489760.1 SGNH/GDSL hydrolase family protein [Cellulophaga sp. 2_MG-2023]MDO6495046.1 SGNH/GDSL hydrolase family protein [Cellulophaga sp. 3_MG-2023]
MIKGVLKYFVICFGLLINLSSDIDESRKTCIQANNIFLGIDSLTEGAGGSSYRDFFFLNSDLPRVGYLPINYADIKALGISSFVSKGMKWFSSDFTYGTFPKRLSVDGKGLFTNNGNNDKCILYISKLNYNRKIRLYYLKQPDGGTFKISVTRNKKDSKGYFINTESKSLGIGYVEIFSQNSSSLNVYNIYGKVALFGVYFKNESCQKDIVNSLAKGGVKMNDIANLDRDFRREWFRILKPTLYILNAGMNDRKTVKPRVFERNLKDYIADIGYGAPNCKIILVEPNESKDYLNTFMPKYREIRCHISMINSQVFYYSIPENIGDYSFFKNKNLMLDDQHPNKKGNIIVGKALFTFSKKLNSN